MTDSESKLDNFAKSAAIIDGSEKKAAILDGDSKTSWKALAKDSTATVDLGESKSVSALTLKWTSRAPASYTIETSVDNENWEVAYATDSSFGNVEQISFDARQAQYVRIRDIKQAEDSRYAPEMYELKIYGDQLVEPEASDEQDATEPVLADTEENDNQLIWLIAVSAVVLVLAIIAGALIVKKWKAD